MEHRNIGKALVPTNRELKEQLKNLNLLFGRRLASEMPTNLKHVQWNVTAIWKDAIRDTVDEWLDPEVQMKGEHPTKRQLAALLLLEAERLQRELTVEQK